MPVSRADRRQEWEPRMVEVFGAALAPAALDLLELTELAWHDCYGEITPSEPVIEDILTVSGGTLEGLIHATKLAVTDHRDLRLAADERRRRS